MAEASGTSGSLGRAVLGGHACNMVCHTVILLGLLVDCGSPLSDVLALGSELLILSNVAFKS